MEPSSTHIGNVEEGSITIATMTIKALKVSDVVPNLHQGEDMDITAKQAMYLQALVEAGGIATQEKLLKAVSTTAPTLCRWRKDLKFRKAEQAAYRQAITQTLPEAVSALKRLLRADLDYGAKGLATMERAVFRLLEVSGIFTKPPAAPTVALAATLQVNEVQKQPLDIAVQGKLPNSLDGEWS